MIAQFDCSACYVRRGDLHRDGCNGKRTDNPYLDAREAAMQELSDIGQKYATPPSPSVD